MARPGLHGNFLPTTQVWDVSEIYSTDVTSPEFKELLVRLYQNLNQNALVTNIKDTGMYGTQEFVNGQVFFSDPSLDSSTSSKPVQRQVFRKVIDFGALPNTATKNTDHGIDITAKVTFTRIYGTSSDTTGNTYIPLPYASDTDSIEMWVDATKVYVKTLSDWSASNKTYIILEYLKN